MVMENENHVFKYSSHDPVFFPILICLFSIVCVRNKIFAFGFNTENLPYPSVLHDKKDWFTNNSRNFVHNWYIYF